MYTPSHRISITMSRPIHVHAVSQDINNNEQAHTYMYIHVHAVAKDINNNEQAH